MCALTCCVVFADAFQALRILPKQLAVLQASEEETRQVRLGGMKDSTPPYCLSCDASVCVGRGEVRLQRVLPSRPTSTRHWPGCTST